MKNPGTAAVLSFLMAGLGQMYCGKIVKGLLLFVVQVILTGIAIVTLGIGAVILVPFWIWNIYDAHSTAKKMNLQNTEEPARDKQPPEETHSRKSLFRNLAISLAFVLLVAGIIRIFIERSNGHNLLVSPRNESNITQPATPVCTLTANALSTEFARNRLAAKVKYEGKLLVIKGIISHADIDSRGNPYVRVDSHSSLSYPTVTCYFAPSYSQAISQLTENNKITVTGRCNGTRDLFGLTSLVDIEDCSF